MLGTTTQIGDVQQSVVRWTIATRDAAAIQAKLHIQILNADVVNHLIEGALQESRVDRANRFQSFARHAGRKGDAVLFGDAHIKRAFGKFCYSASQTPVPSGMAAVSATIFSSFAINSQSVSPKTVV